MEKQDEFRALKTVTLEQLAKLLYIRQDTISEYDCTQWLTGQARQIKNLNSTLVPTTLKSAAQGLLNFSQAFDPKPGHGPLCSVHSELSADILDVLRDLVIRECTTHTDRYRHRRQKHCLSPLLSNWLTRVDEISVLWMGKEHWQQRMRREVAIAIPWSATKPCMACQLAVVGGSARFLTDLKASLLARDQYSREIHRRRDSVPALLPMVDAWINMCYPQDQRRAIHDESRMLAGMVFAMRDQMRQVRETVDRQYHRSTAARNTTEGGLPVPRSVSQREHEREPKRRKNGEFYGERDSGWLWSPSGSGTGGSSGGPDFTVSGDYGGKDELFLNGPHGSKKGSQSSGIMDKIDADWHAAGCGGSRSTAKDVEYKIPRKGLPVDNLAGEMSRLNLFRSWNESGALNNGDYSREEHQAVLQQDVDIYKGADFARTGDARPLGEPRYFTIADLASDRASDGVDSVFTVSPASSAGDALPQPAPSSKYSANPGPPPSTTPSLPSPKTGPSTQWSVQRQQQQQLQRGARNRERTPPRRHRRQGSDEAVNGDLEEEYFVAPKPLAQRRVLKEYRTQIQSTRPPQQLTEVAKGSVGLVSAEDVASCYAGMGWGGPRKR
jgi:hypothetical protein